MQKVCAHAKGSLEGALQRHVPQAAKGGKAAKK
jgi:hypothetical protein